MCKSNAKGLVSPVLFTDLGYTEGYILSIEQVMLSILSLHLCSFNGFLNYVL